MIRVFSTGKKDKSMFKFPQTAEWYYMLGFITAIMTVWVILTIFYSLFNVKFIMTVEDTNQNIPTYCEYDEDESAT